MPRLPRICLILCTLFIGVTSAAGGVALVLGSLLGDATGLILPPQEYLAGSGMGSYALPGMILLVVVSGTQFAALALLARHSRAAHAMCAIAAFGILIWIFVQMVFIPFSALQALYFLFGLAEIGFVLLALGLFPTERSARPRTHDASPEGTSVPR